MAGLFSNIVESGRIVWNGWEGWDGGRSTLKLRSIKHASELSIGDAAYCLIGSSMIYLVRHGQTEFNLERRHYGHVDSPLTELGREQARRAGEALVALIDLRDTVIFSSPLGRALQTARMIADVATVERSIIVDPDLMEIGMGSAEGMTQAEMEKRWPAPQAASANGAMSFQSPDGENLKALAQRLDRALRRVADHHAASRIVVSHGVAGRMLRALHLGLDNREAFRLDAPQDALFRLNGSEITRISFRID
jgi:broad specificity phosphatase PhoE